MNDLDQHEAFADALAAAVSLPTWVLRRWERRATRRAARNTPTTGRDRPVARRAVGPTPTENAVTTCTWLLSCPAPARQAVWRQTRPGLVIHEAVCDHHLPDATDRYGYRTDRPPIPPPADRSVPHPPAGR